MDGLAAGAEVELGEHAAEIRIEYHAGRRIRHLVVDGEVLFTDGDIVQ
jgi:hypothetical protein